MEKYCKGKVETLLKLTIGENEAEQRLDRFLRKYMKDASLTDIYSMIRKKHVRVNGKRAKENYRLKSGDALEIDAAINAVKSCIKPAKREFGIIYEDDNVLIVDKPMGLIVHPDLSHSKNTLVDQVVYYLYQNGSYNPENETTFKPSSVNRLDLNTGGLVLFAKNYMSLRKLSSIVRSRALSKYYICVVKGRVECERDIRAYLTKDDKLNKVAISYEPNTESRAIHTKIRPLSYNEGFTLLEIDLITGRSHQIRAQLSKIGNPVIGDMKYGDREVNFYFKEGYGLKTQLLYAYKLKFKEISGDLDCLSGRMFTSNLPSLYKNILDALFQYNIR